MSLYEASKIEFDFTAAMSVFEHDRTSPSHPGGFVHGNNFWPGVDFCIQEASGWIWLEVKSWNPTHIDAHRRGGSRWSFICKMRSKVFATELRNKFIGTTAFLAWSGTFPLAPVTYVFLFEPPHPMDAALVGSRGVRIRDLIVNPRVPWALSVHVALLTLHEWNLRYRQYPTRLLP